MKVTVKKMAMYEYEVKASGEKLGLATIDGMGFYRIELPNGSVVRAKTLSSLKNLVTKAVGANA